MLNNFESEKFESKQEKEKNPKLMFVFDVDGIITNPDTKKPNEKVIEHISSDLKQGFPVALATGRSVAWVEEKIMPTLKTMLKDDRKLDFLLISGEKGSVSVEYVDGEPVKKIDKNNCNASQNCNRSKKDYSALP